MLFSGIRSLVAVATVGCGQCAFGCLFCCFDGGVVLLGGCIWLLCFVVCGFLVLVCDFGLVVLICGCGTLLFVLVCGGFGCFALVGGGCVIVVF